MVSVSAYIKQPELYNHPASQAVLAALPSKLAYYSAVAMGAYPLCMHQQSELFSSSRLPGKGMDYQFKTRDPDSITHAIVQVLDSEQPVRNHSGQRGSKFYKLNILCPKYVLLEWHGNH